ncbi:neocarzinostatin apoprotein domain-containing protein [Actinoplanes sp. HUAS TT8]|uniref:neocarzinostatin apoprotein domain-containing protein n=1 Tax=Actinoplanes sp. HUAS TT8 TaxID=3447453 RepID=UPI003F521386
MVRSKNLILSVAIGILAATGVVLVDGSPASAKPTLHVSRTSGLKSGQSITVYGTGFTKNLTNIALGQCIKNPASSTDCNLSGGAEFVDSDASGKTRTVTLKLATTFSGHKCGTTGCVIAAQLLPSSNPADVVAANKVQVAITFTGGTGTTTAPTTAATSTSSTSAAATGTTDSDALPKTGPGLEWATMGLIGTALLLPGLGLLAMLPARRRRML